MKKSFLSLFIVVVTLFSIGYSAVYAETVDGSKEIVALFSQLEEKFLDSAKKFDWTHVIIQTEHGNGTKSQREDWYKLVDGEIEAAYEWALFEDNINVDQTGMLKGGVWYNLTLEQKRSANSTKLAFTTEFLKGIKSALLSGDKISVSEEIKDDHSVYAFSYQYDVEKQNIEEKTNDGLSSVRSVLYVEGESGKPVESKLYFVYEDGSEILQRWTSFHIEVGKNPPMEKIKAIGMIIDKDGLSYEWVGGSTGQKYPYYQTKYRAENMTVSGLSITSYKRILIRPDFWTGMLYTGVGSGILQQAGAEWYSIQEYCNSTTINKWISTTPVIYNGVADWYKSSGNLSYEPGCSQLHEVYVNGSHYAKYNDVVMIPSPNFSIWWPAP